MVFSHLNCCILSWRNACKTALVPLLKLHKQAVRLITNSDYRAHAKPLFKTLNMLTVHVIHKLEIAKFKHRVSSQCETTNLSSFTPLNSIHNYSTRISTASNYFVNRTNTKLGRKVNVFLDTKSLKTFTKKYKQYLLSLYE